MNPLNRILRWVYRHRPRFSRKRGYVLEYDVTTATEPPAPSFPLRIVALDPNDEERLREIIEWCGESKDYGGNPEPMVRGFLARGDRCYLALNGEEVVCRVWVATDHPFRIYDHDDVALAPDEAYFFDAYTAKTQRGQGIYPYVKYQLGRRLLEQEGRKRLVSCVEAGNQASLAASNKIGVHLTHRIGSLHLGWWTFTYGVNELGRKTVSADGEKKPAGELPTG